MKLGPLILDENPLRRRDAAPDGLGQHLPATATGADRRCH
jgi:hypothetical protein